jgi:putative transposase
MGGMKRHLFKHDIVFDRITGTEVMLVTDPTLVPGRIKVYDLIEEVEKFIAFDDIKSGIATGVLEIHRTGEANTSGSHPSRTEEDQEFGNALRFVNLLVAEMDSSRSSALQSYEKLKKMFVAGVLDLNEFPSRPTAYRHLARRRQDLPILFGNSGKGNRSPRYSEAVTRLVIEKSEQLFLVTKSRFTLSKLTEHINNVAHDDGLLSRATSISRKYVERVIHEHLTRDSEKARMDPKDAIAAKAIAGNRIRIAAPFMRIEQDGLHIPWELSTPYGPSRDVWHIHAIDCSTSMPVGWLLSIGAPTVSKTLACVESILFSKKQRLAALGLEYEFDCYGTPSLLVFDNGGENKGDRIQRLTRMGIDPMHCKSRHAHGKPFIERLNGSLKRDLEILSGGTRFDGKDGARDPHELGDVPTDITSMESWIVRWYYEHWAHQPLERHLRSVFVDEEWMGATPLARWNKFSTEMGYAMTLPPSLDSWRMIRYEHHRRTLSRKTGITFEDWQFRGGNLAALIETFGEIPIDIYVDVDDFRCIYLPTVGGSELIELVNIDVDTTTPAYSFKRAREILEDARSRTDASTSQANFRRDLFRSAISPFDPTANRPKSSVKVSKATTKRAKDFAAVERARNAPLKPSHIGTQTDVSPSAEPQFEDAPVLEVFSRTKGVSNQ